VLTQHYYSNQPSAASDRQVWDFTLRGNKLLFTTDQGVFSKKEVDFGSRVLIEAFVFPDVEGPILDVGCGYGPIGLSLAKERPSTVVHMVDVNERAMELARLNAQKNNILNVHVFNSYCYDGVKPDEQYGAILTNPPIRAGKAVVHAILEGAVQRLLPGGELWVVIQKKQGAPSALEKLESLFGEVEVVEKKKGYYIIRAKKVDE
jgi:16S rRNA (guanine1207-N2)-methyltransferase